MFIHYPTRRGLSEYQMKELKEEIRKTEYQKTVEPYQKEIRKLKQEIEKLKKREQECIDHYLVQCKYASEMEDKYITANHIIKELAFIFDDYNEFNKILEKYNYELKGSANNE